MSCKTDMVAEIMEGLDEDLIFDLAWHLLAKLPLPVLKHLHHLGVQNYTLQQSNESLRASLKQHEEAHGIVPIEPKETPRPPTVDYMACGKYG